MVREILDFNFILPIKGSDTMSLMDTPRANRLHIGLYGKRNSGKSSLINALTGQEIALVSNEAGTTTDPVYKSMEIYGIGPCVFIDTAGFDDVGTLGSLRVEKTKEAALKTDIALILFTDESFDQELEWASYFKAQHTPIIPIINKVDLLAHTDHLIPQIESALGASPILVSAKNKIGIEAIRASLIRLLPEDYEAKSITGTLAAPGDLVLLVMPQDIQAPKGRLILPQVQTLRDLLDKKCLVMSCTTDQMANTLKALAKAPDLIITDSQVFKTVYEQKPPSSKLTSFSVLFASYKGDVEVFKEGAYAIKDLTQRSKVLIAEACTHAPLNEDIGREKLPRLLRAKVGEGLTIDITSGPHFPSELQGYDLIIHCGACMFNRKYVLSRIHKANALGIPISNYGMVLAYLSGILEQINF